jgi:hypothetical protein
MIFAVMGSKEAEKQFANPPLEIWRKDAFLENNFLGNYIFVNSTRHSENKR